MVKVWYEDDIERILTALASAGIAHWPEYHKALYDVALAFGVDLTKPVGDWREKIDGRQDTCLTT